MGWRGAELVETLNGPANNAKGVLFDDGLALAVWHGGESYQAPRRIYSSFLKPGMPWSTPRAIDMASGEPLRPQLAANRNGDLVAVWVVRSSNGFNQDIHVNTYFLETGWEMPQVLQSSGLQDQPQAAINDDGTALVVWQEMNAQGVKSVASSRFTQAAGWEVPQYLGQADYALSSPEVGVDAAGNGVATWLDRPPSDDSDIVARRFTDGVGWSMTEAVESLAGDASAFEVAFDNMGRGLASWWQSEDSNHSLYASEFDPVSGWSTAEPIGPDNGTPGYLSLALSANGNAVAVWTQETPESQHVYAAHKQPDGTWGDPRRIDSLEGIATRPTVAIDADGDAVAVWLQHDGETNSVFGAQFDPLTGWGPQLQFETENGFPARWFDARSPSVVMNPRGNALVVWTQFDGEQYSIYANRFDDTN